MIESEQLLSSPELERWLRSPGIDRLEPAERDQMIELVLNFCGSRGQTPSEIVAGCFRIDKDGDRAISTKGRRIIQDHIEEFVADLGFTGHAATVAGNRIRSFLIHNGVFMQGRISKA